MTATATKVKDGPFDGRFPSFSERAALYALSEPLEHDGMFFTHAVVSAIPADSWGPQETIVLGSDSEARVFVSDVFPFHKEGMEDKAGALRALGYEVLEPVPAEG